MGSIKAWTDENLEMLIAIWLMPYAAAERVNGMSMHGSIDRQANFFSIVWMYRIEPSPVLGNLFSCLACVFPPEGKRACLRGRAITSPEQWRRQFARHVEDPFPFYGAPPRKAEL